MVTGYVVYEILWYSNEFETCPLVYAPIYGFKIRRLAKYGLNLASAVSGVVTGKSPSFFRIQNYITHVNEEDNYLAEAYNHLREK